MACHAHWRLAVAFVAQAPYEAVAYTGDGVDGGTGRFLYVADFANNVVRQVDLATGQETVVAGDGLKGNSNGGPATTARRPPRWPWRRSRGWQWTRRGTCS